MPLEIGREVKLARGEFGDSEQFTSPIEMAHCPHFHRSEGEALLPNSSTDSSRTTSRHLPTATVMECRLRGPVILFPPKRVCIPARTRSPWSPLEPRCAPENRAYPLARALQS